MNTSHMPNDPQKDERRIPRGAGNIERPTSNEMTNDHRMTTE